MFAITVIIRMQSIRFFRNNVCLQNLSISFLDKINETVLWYELLKRGAKVRLTDIHQNLQFVVQCTNAITVISQGELNQSKACR